MKLNKKMKSQPKGHPMMAGGGAGHYGKKAKEAKISSAGAHSGHGPAHATKGGGSGAHGKKVRQTANAKNEHLAMLTGSGHYGRNHVGPVKSGTFMQKMVASRGY